MAQIPPLLVGVSSTPLSIGGVVFQSREAPNELPLGARKHNVVVTELPGGGRILARMGAQPLQVTWEGMLYDDNLDDRVKTLESYNDDGKERLVSYRNERYYCIVREFTPTYINPVRCRYKIVIEISRPANGTLTSARSPSVDDQVTALIGDATKHYGSLVPDEIPTSVGIGATATSAYIALPTALATVRQAVQGVLPISQITPDLSTNVLSSVSAATLLVTSILAAVPTTSATYVAARRLYDTLSLIAANVQRGQVQKTLTTQGGSLYEIASTYLGDITRAFDLQSVNKLVSPIIPWTAVVNVRIPPLGGSS